MCFCLNTRPFNDQGKKIKKCIWKRRTQNQRKQIFNDRATTIENLQNTETLCTHGEVIAALIIWTWDKHWKKVEKNYNQTTSYAYFEQFVRFVLHSFSCFLTMCKMHVRAASWRKPLIIIIKLEIRAETEMCNRMKQKDTKVLYSTVKVWVCVLCVCVFCHLSLRDINNKMKR